MDEETIVDVYRECVRPLYRYVACRCGPDRFLAEDVTQEAWLRAMAHWERRGIPENPLAWLKTVARNLVLNHMRRAPPISLDALPRDWESRFLRDRGWGRQEEVAAALTWGLARMKPGQARLIESFHLEGRSVKEIAEDRKLSERAVEGRLRRARKKLRSKMEPLLRDEGGLE